MSRLRSIANGLAAALLIALAAPAAAAACNVNPQGVSFGNYDPLGAIPLDGVGNVHVQCDLPIGFNVSIGSGAGTVADRRMTGGAAQLRYNLYKDATRLFVWGEGIQGLDAIGTNVHLPVYGRIPGTQNIPAGIYLDSVSVTVTF